MELNRSSDFLTEVGQSSWIGRRTQLEKGLMIALILGSAAIVGFFINIVRFDIENQATCDTPNCILVAAQVINQVDVNVDPCDDFFLFACGNLVNVTPTEHYPKRLLQNKLEKQMQNLLEEAIDQNDDSILNYEKELYQACVADKNGVNALETLKQIFNELNGWPVVVGSSWDEKNFNWIDWVPKFHKYGLNHMQILRYFLDVDSENSTKVVLEILPPFSFLVERTRQMQHNILINVATIFGADKIAAHQEMTEVMDLMWNIHKIKDEYINYTHVEESTQARVAEFQRTHKELNWLHYFNSLTEPEHTMKLDDYFAFRHVDCVKTILDLVQKTPKRIIANYMFWYAVDDLLPVLTSDVFDFINIQDCLWDFSRKTRTDMCKEIIMHSPLSSIMAFGKKYLTRKSRIQVTDIFNRVKKEFIRLFRISKWMNEKNKAKVKDSFNTMTEIIGLKNQTTNYTLYHDFFKKKLKPQDGFLKMYLNLKQARNSFANEAALKEQWVYDFAYFNYGSDVQTIYLRFRNTIILPVGILQDWYYDEEKPMYVNFATFGKSIGAAFTNMITGIHVFEDDDVPWSDETKRGFEEATNCISRKNEDDPMAEYYDYKKMEVGQITGLKVAYNAYRGWVKANGEELPVKGTTYTSAQLFWISALTDSCYEDAYGFTLFKDNEPIKQNPNFATDFECESNSQMNPPKKCNIL